MGSSNVATILHAASILLRIESGWDWFITLSARDYPLISQDGNANWVIVSFCVYRHMPIGEWSSSYPFCVCVCVCVLLSNLWINVNVLFDCLFI